MNYYVIAFDVDKEKTPKNQMYKSIDKNTFEALNNEEVKEVLLDECKYEVVDKSIFYQSNLIYQSYNLLLYVRKNN